MNIAFVFDDTLDNPDGVQQYIFALSEYLIANKHTVHFLVGETKRTDLKNIYSLSKNIRVKFNGNVVGTPLPASKQKIKSLINELNIDVIHVQMPYSPLLAGRVIKCVSPDTGVIGTFHVFPQSKFEAFLSKALTIVNRTTLKKFDEFIAVSKVAKQASHIKNRNISIIPNPIDLSK
jgi:phosphatidyl-myo-inositol alpha-mannosyltransferase